MTPRDLERGISSWSAMQRADDAAILAWAATQPWAAPMRACAQDAKWHAEGDVWTHTCMVCEQLTALEPWASLDRVAQLKLLLTALFHDSGKPATTAPDPETGRLRSPMHALVGAQIARAALRDLGLPVSLREEIVSMVRYHSRPGHLAAQPAYDRPVIYTSWLLSNRLLHLFALADSSGRVMIHDDTTQASINASLNQPLSDRLELWRMACEEVSCYDAPYSFANDQARFLFYRDQLSSLYYTPHEDYRCTVTMIAGLPGSGKDTWLNQHRADLPVVSLDDIRDELDVKATDEQGRVAHLAKDRAREFLRSRLDFSFNATNLTTHVRKRWIDLFADYGARIELVYLEPPLAVVLERNRARASPVPEHIVTGLAQKAEPPTIAECHALRVVE